MELLCVDRVVEVEGGWNYCSVLMGVWREFEGGIVVC